MSKGYNFIIALTGMSSSGKDSIARLLANQHKCKYVVSTTTRPMRSGEKQDIDYHFVSEEEFQKLIDEDKLVEHRYYDTIENGLPTRWNYGVERSEINLDEGDFVVVVDLKGLEDLKKEYGDKVISFYIDVPEEIRRVRAIARDRFFEEAEFSRRCRDDVLKFEDVENKVDIVVKNDDLNECLSRVLFDIDYAKKLRIFYTQYASY